MIAVVERKHLGKQSRSRYSPTMTSQISTTDKTAQLSKSITDDRQSMIFSAGAYSGGGGTQGPAVFT